MSSWIRKVRGALGTAVTWGAAWGLVGAALGAVGFPFLSVEFVLRAMAFSGLFFGTVGFLAGGSFATVLGAMEGKRSFDELSLARTTVWGAAGALVVPLLLMGAALVLGADIRPGNLTQALTVFATLGGLSSGGSLLLARMGADEREGILPEELDRAALGGGPAVFGALDAGLERERTADRERVR